jgi:hypothetical protein
VDYYDGAGSTSTNATPDYNYDGPGIMSNYREMQTTYAALSSAEQTNQYVYLELAKILLCDQTMKMVDLWGDIPFFQAGSLNTSRSLSLAPFDDAATIYDSLDTYLQEVNTYLASATIASEVTAALPTADFIYKGSISSWRMYANSLRLRLLMRISNVSEATAKAEVTTMLADPSTYPLITDNTYNALFNESPTTVVSDMLSSLSTPWAPAYLSDTVMHQNGDPRMDVYFDHKYDTAIYQGYPIDSNAASYEGGHYTTYDSATILYNYNLPGVLFTASEINYLRAEAYERWSLGTAETEYYAGIDNSIAFYYGLNANRIFRSGASAWPILTTPDAGTVATFKANANIVYSGSTTDKLARIYTQKWAHFWILQADQAWAEYRRTDYPVLKFATATNASAAQPPKRLLYTTTETTYNTTNYSKVSAKDTRDTKIFWDVN